MFKQTVLAALFLGSVALADHHGEMHGKGPCKKDMETLCKDSMGDKEKAHQCMKDNLDKVSPECKANWEMMKSEMKEVKEACAKDVETLCAGVEEGHGRIMKCLKDNKAKVSEACQAEMKDMKKTMKKMKHKK